MTPVTLSSVAILAGGLATRIRPLTETAPKAVLDVAGRPFIHWQLESLARQGVREVVICAAYRAEQIEEVVGNGTDFGLKVSYSLDGPKLLGTAGALKKALPLLGKQFFVLYGDSWLPCEFRAIQEQFELSGKSGLMTVYRNEGRFDQSNVEYRDGHILAYDKKRPTDRMHYIDYGLEMFRDKALEHVPPEEPWDLAQLCQDLLGRDELAAVEVGERFYEIGSAEGLEELRELLSDRKGK